VGGQHHCLSSSKIDEDYSHEQQVKQILDAAGAAPSPTKNTNERMVLENLGDELLDFQRAISVARRIVAAAKGANETLSPPQALVDTAALPNYDDGYSNDEDGSKETHCAKHHTTKAAVDSSDWDRRPEMVVAHGFHGC